MRVSVKGDISKEDRDEIVSSICKDLGLDFKKVKKDFYKFGNINDSDMLKFAKDNGLEISFNYSENKVIVFYECEEEAEEQKTPVKDQGVEIDSLSDEIF